MAGPVLLDYGPLGVELKNNVKRRGGATWYRTRRYRGTGPSILMPPPVCQASGHLDHFTDPMVELAGCKHRFRSDQIVRMASADSRGEACKHCGSANALAAHRAAPYLT